MRTIVALVAVMASAAAQDDAANRKRELQKELARLDAEIKKKKDEWKLHQARATCLAKLERHDEAFKAAGVVMNILTKQDFELAWIIIESVDLGHVRVDIHFNMGERERKAPDRGIVRPLTFRIWNKPAKGEEPKLLGMFDFEYGYWEGKRDTAAFGETTENGHSSYGVVDLATPYSGVRKQGLELVGKHHPAPKKDEPADK